MALAIWICFSGLILCVLKKMLATKRSCFETKPSEAVCMLIDFFCLHCLLTSRDENLFLVLILENYINPLDSYQKKKNKKKD